MRSESVLRTTTLVLCCVLTFVTLPTLEAARTNSPPLRTTYLPAVHTSPLTASAIEVWLTDLAAGTRLERQPDLTFDGAAETVTQTIVLDENRRYQSMIGFGASFTDSAAWLVGTRLGNVRRAHLMRELFSRDEGIALQVIRQPMGASDFAVNGNYSYDDVPAGQSDPTLAQFSVEYDDAYIVPVLKEALAVNPDITLMASPWSPPAWMKTSDSMIKGSLKPEAYGPFAQYFVRFVQAYAQRGLTVDYLTTQNEPLYQPDGYPGMLMTPDQQQVFLRDNLGPALASAGLDTRILGYDHNWDVPSYPETLYSDPQTAQYIAGTAWHCYGGNVAAQTAVHNSYPLEETHHTECSGGDWQGTDQAAFNGVIGLVINAPRHWSRDVVLWNMALDQNNGPTNGGCLECRGVVEVQRTGNTYTKNLDYYALGHASKFVYPGAARIGSNSYGQGNIETVAFHNPNGTKVLVAHNSGTSARTFAVRWGDRSFDYTLAAGAAVTFHWNGTQAGTTPGYDSLMRQVDLPFRAADGSTVVLTYGDDQAEFQHSVLDGERSFNYTLPVGAEVSLGGTESRLPRTGWIASASATAGGSAPTNALDGDPATTWSVGHGQTNGDWFQVDLGDSRTFDGIVLDAAGSIGDFVRGYQVYTSDDGQHWSNAIASGPGNGQVVRIVFPSVTARYVRVVSTVGSGNWWSIAEFDLLARAQTATARTTPDAVAMQGFVAPDGAAGSAVFNSDNAPVTFTTSVWGQTSFDVTLPAYAAMIFTWHGANGGAKTPTPAITSFDPVEGLLGSTVTITGTGFGMTQGASAVRFGDVVAPVRSWSDTLITAVVPEGVTATEVELVVVRGGRASAPRTFSITTLDGALPRDGWTAEASASSAEDPAANALDGDVFTRWSSGTGQAPGMTFDVDMQTARTFSQIVLDAGPSDGDYARGYEVYVSNDGASWGVPIATGPGSGRLIDIQFDAQTARYVRIKQTGSSGSWWSIAELYVFP